MRRFKLKTFRSDERGAAMVEFSLVLMLVLLLTGGIVEFSLLFFQWNSATKALQQGVRLASVSNPVATGLTGMTGLGGTVTPGDKMPDFKIVCTNASCACTGTACGASYSVDTAALNTIVYGRGNGTTCGTVGLDKFPGMCDIYSKIKPENLLITYEQTGLGFAGRPGGPVPTITIELRGLTFGFVFLAALMKFTPITLPAMKTTATGEDLASTAPAAL